METHDYVIQKEQFLINSIAFVSAKSFDYVIGLENSSFDAIKVFKSNVTQS